MFDIINEDKGLSRRQLITGAGKIAAGAALVGACGSSLVTRASASTDADAYPWPYKKLDPAKTAAIAYENWYKGFCSYAVTSSVFSQLRESVGGPYKHLPLDAFNFAHGGTVGWGTLCGTLFGAGVVASFTMGKEGEKITNDMLAWYSDTELPIFMPANPKATFKNVSKSDSPLCHVSVGKWMKKEGVAIGSPERKDRCARLAADVAYQTVVRLNEMADGKYKPVNGSQVKAFGITAQNNCTDCHGSNVPTPPGK